jgi:glycosyltransferase involved in cell wall biosynthesis
VLPHPESPNDAAPVRVLLLISNLEFGGAQRQVVELANQLDPRQFEVHVGTLSDYLPLADGIRLGPGRVHVVQKAFKYDLTVVPRLRTLLRRLRIDVVQSYLFDADIAARLAGRLAGIAVVGAERNTDYALKPQQRAAYRLTRGMVDLIIANSRAGAAFNQRLLGYDASFYRVVHNGVDTRRFRPGDGSALRAALGVAPDERVVGMFASFKRQKNHPLAFEAARLVLDRLPRTRFAFVGDMLWAGLHGSAEYKQRMDALVDELGIRDRCLFLGNRSDVADLYRACDVTLLPSLFEGTPNVVLESLASGVPVVATDVADNRLLLPEGEVGHVVPLGDAGALAARLLDLLADDAGRRRAGAAARAWAEREFSTTALAEKTGAIYRELLARRSARG